MLNLAVANQKRNDLTAQQVLPTIVESLSRVKLSMEANISFVPTERVPFRVMIETPRKTVANFY